MVRARGGAGGATLCSIRRPRPHAVAWSGGAGAVQGAFHTRQRRHRVQLAAPRVHGGVYTGGGGWRQRRRQRLPAGRCLRRGGSIVSIPSVTAGDNDWWTAAVFFPFFFSQFFFVSDVDYWWPTAVFSLEMKMIGGLLPLLLLSPLTMVGGLPSVSLCRRRIRLVGCRRFLSSVDDYDSWGVGACSLSPMVIGRLPSLYLSHRRK